MTEHNAESWSLWRHRVHTIIFEAETPSGKAFDVVLMLAILCSVAAVVLESVDSIRASIGAELHAIEWFFTILFTLEYLLRLVSVRRPWSYATSFFGLIDLFAVMPTYLGLFVGGAHSLIVVRAFRLLRVFRVFKLIPFLGEADQLVLAMRASLPKIIVFLGTVLSIALLMGSIMYLVEGSENGFSNIPVGIYWAIVTMTTVGYGDIAPHTILGQFIAAALMVLGYAIIAVPTGIVSSEIFHASRGTRFSVACPHCMKEGHARDAIFCRCCGMRLDPIESQDPESQDP